MCGIYGYTSKNPDAAVVTLRGLKALEYRGYGSYGFAGRNGGDIQILKRVDKVSNASPLPGNYNATIGHTRWATHGPDAEKNAHPHCDMGQTLALVHNGIITNHEALRALLKKSLGDVFVSDTDTEVIVHLIRFHMSQGLTFEQATMHAARELEGRFAFVVMNNTSHRLIGVRFESPLLLGIGPEGRHVSSDTSA